MKVGGRLGMELWIPWTLEDGGQGVNTECMYNAHTYWYVRSVKTKAPLNVHFENKKELA